MSSKPDLKAFEKLSFYEVLGVSQDVGGEELKKAYRLKALEHHPDKNLEDTEGSRARFLLVKKAFETLSDDASRADYDFTRANLRSTGSGTSAGFQHDFYQNHNQSPFNTQRAHNGYHTPPSDSPYDNLHPLLKPFALLLGFLIFVVVGSAGYVLSIISGPRLPAPVAHFNPATFCRIRYPTVRRENSTTIDQILAFMEALSALQLTLDSGPTSWFTIFGNFFVCIEFEERLHGIDLNKRPPPFGDISTPRNTVEAFYKYWTNFETFKDFSWMSFHQVPPEYLVTPFGRAQAEHQNHFGRQVHKMQYEGLIRALAKKLSESDPRRGFRGNPPRSRPTQAKAAKGQNNNNKKSKKRRR